MTPGKGGAELSRRQLMTGLFGAIVVGGSVAALSGCAPSEITPVPSDDGASTVTATVRAFDNRYEPAEVTVRLGEAVTWVFEGPSEHDVVANDRSFVSELMREGSYTHIFDTVGEYDYLCSIHPEMRGLVTVV